MTAFFNAPDANRRLMRVRLPAIFGSEVFPSPVLEQIGKEAGVKFVDSLRDDDLPGEVGGPTHSYLGLIADHEKDRARIDAISGRSEGA